MRRRALLTSMGAVGAVLITGLTASLVTSAAHAARPGPSLEVSIIQATDVDGGARAIDPALRDLPQLTRDQPFVRYNVYRLLERRQYPFEVGRVVTVGLPNGRTLLATLVGLTTEKAERRYQIEAQIAEPGKQAFLRSLHVTTSELEPFFVGGQSYSGGTLFLELLVRP